MKRRYGLPATLIRIVSEDVDLGTGVKTQVRDSLQISRVIILPSTIKREFFYDLAWITGNKDFTYGGDTLTGSRKFVIDRNDLGTWSVKVEDALIYDGNRYDVQEVDEFENRLGYLITARESTSVPVNNIVETELYHELFMKDAATVVVGRTPILISVSNDLGLTDEAVNS
jgi:hypothetical protein